jgi:hypothetical protein
MIALICGGRDFVLVQRAWDFLDAHHARTQISFVVTGLDPSKPCGADQMGDKWAESRGIDRAAFPPNWIGRGRPGGPHRNGLMLKFIRPEIIFAFPTGGPGTADMMKQARSAGLRVVEAKCNEIGKFTGAA